MDGRSVQPDAQQDAICQAVAAFLARHDPSLRPGTDDELFASGMLNSLFALELITFLENRYSIKFSGGDLELARFSSLGRIARTVQEKQTATAAAAGGD